MTDIILVVVGTGGVLALVGIGYAALTAVRKLGERLEGKNVSMSLFTPDKDCTTVIPVPIHAGTCDHSWDILTDQVLEMPHEKKTVTILSCRQCGLIDKTVQTTSPPPPPPKPLPPPPEPPCKHEWQVQVSQELHSKHEDKIVVVMTCRHCGLVDKTVEANSKFNLSTKSECRHKWETEKKVELLSAYEQMLKSISVKENYGRTAKVDPSAKINLDLNKAPAWMFRKTYISLRICSLCGEIDKTITSNFELDGQELPAGRMPDNVPEVAADEDDVPPPISIKRKKG